MSQNSKKFMSESTHIWMLTCFCVVSLLLVAYGSKQKQPFTAKVPNPNLGLDRVPCPSERFR